MDLLYDLAYYSVIGIVVFLVILALYLKLFKRDIIKMKKFYALGAKLSDENKVQRIIKIAIEKFVRKILQYEKFDFDNPVYFDKNDKLLNIAEEEYESSPSAPIQLSEPAANVPKEEDDKITYDDMKQVLYNDLSEDKVFIGMTNDSLKNLGIAIGIQVLGVAVAKLGKKAKVALKKSLQTGGSKVVTKIARKLGIKFMQKGSEKVAKMTLKVVAKSTAKVMKTIIAKFGVNIAMKFGYYSARSLATKALNKFSNKIINGAAKAAAKAGGQAAKIVSAKLAAFAAKAASKASMGPVGWALLAFDLISLGLDLGDGGGYGNLDTAKDARNEINKSSEEQYRQLREADIPFPSNVGPFDKYIWNDDIDYADKLENAEIAIVKRDPYYLNSVKNAILPNEVFNREAEIAEEMKIKNIILELSSSDREKLKNQAIEEMCEKEGAEILEGICNLPTTFDKEFNRRMSIELDPKGKWTKPILDENEKWLANNPNATEDEIDKNLESLQNTYLSDAVLEQITTKIMNEWCTSEGGKMLLDGTTCTYNNPTDCEKHYFHEDGKTNRTYTRWDTSNNKCVSADKDIEKACIDAKLKYNTNNGLCEMTPEFCKRKSVEWDSEKKECVLPVGQEIAEFLFGTTVVRGLNQIFDPRQYKQCPPGTSDIGYGCSRNESGNPDCGAMYGDGWKDNGTRCTNQGTTTLADCPSGYYNSGLTCTKKLYGRGVGLNAKDVKDYSCPSGWNHASQGLDDCWTCPSGYSLSHTGGHCYKEYLWGQDWASFLRQSKDESMKPQNELYYSRSAGNAIPDPGEGKRQWEKCGLLYYPKCPDGMFAETCNTCVTNGSINVSLRCNAEDRFLDGVRCVKGIKNSENRWDKPSTNFLDYKCPPGYSPYLGKCRLNCPTDFRDDGLVCWKPRSIDYSTQDN